MILRGRERESVSLCSVYVCLCVSFCVTFLCVLIDLCQGYLGHDLRQDQGPLKSGWEHNKKAKNKKNFKREMDTISLGQAMLL